MLFLIEYDRPSGTLIRIEEFQDSELSLVQETRLALEIELNEKESVVKS
jgi:hypothetical protein